MNSLKRVLEENKKGDDFYALMGDFLDAFYGADTQTKAQMIEQRPTEFVEGTEALAFAAATAHKLANDYGLNCPEWAFEKGCYMTDKPFFACQATEEQRLRFMYVSPTEFKHRNLFVDENVLARV